MVNGCVGMQCVDYEGHYINDLLTSQRDGMAAAGYTGVPMRTEPRREGGDRLCCGGVLSWLGELTAFGIGTA
jgi:hypothetical protein